MIICRRGKLVPEKDQPPCDDEVIAYLDGVECEEPCATLRLNNLRKGEYYILYKPDFKDFHKVRRLNLVFYSEFQPKKTEEELIEEMEQQESLLKQMRSAVDVRAGDQLDVNSQIPGGQQSQPEMDVASNTSKMSKAELEAERQRAMSASRSRQIPIYDPKLAIELERLENSSFKPEFYETMEALNYDRYVDQDKYVPPVFVDPPMN